ncbi:MAG TPA: Hsp20/alpha crystallin family protein [bacterium]|nr:Hsp20/alpha crystallin family protein [bacterium]
MKIKELIPAQWGRSEVPVRRTMDSSPLLDLQRGMNRMFDQFFDDFTGSRFPESARNVYPQIDIRETDQAVEVSAELPGLEREDVDISIAADVLTIRGEKRQEKEEKNGGVRYVERTYGAFRREIPIRAEIEVEKVNAKMKNGVLTVTLPKKPESRRMARRIEVQ